MTKIVAKIYGVITDVYTLLSSKADNSSGHISGLDSRHVGGHITGLDSGHVGEHTSVHTSVQVGIHKDSSIDNDGNTRQIVELF